MEENSEAAVYVQKGLVFKLMDYKVSISDLIKMPDIFIRNELVNE